MSEDKYKVGDRVVYEIQGSLFVGELQESIYGKTFVAVEQEHIVHNFKADNILGLESDCLKILKENKDTVPVYPVRGAELPEKFKGGKYAEIWVAKNGKDYAMEGDPDFCTMLQRVLKRADYRARQDAEILAMFNGVLPPTE